jgi:NAD(P)H dehydrogenase (quinone)
MNRIAIIYFSGSGHVHQMAEALESGASSHPNTSVDLLRITGSQIQNGRWSDESFMESMQAADAIVFGTPTYMGGPSAQFKAFADRSSEPWFHQAWKDKLAGGFTHGAALSGDKVNTLVYLTILAGQHGMIWVNPGEIEHTFLGKTEQTNRLGSYLGVMGQTALDPARKEPDLHSGDRLSTENYGLRIATWVQRVKK